MHPPRVRVLIFSKDPNFLSAFLGHLKSDYEVQFTSAADKALFLVKEWEPSILLIDSEKTALAHLSGISPSIGRLVFAKTRDLVFEEAAFRLGVDGIVYDLTEYQGLKLRIDALAKRVSPIKLVNPSEKPLSLGELMVFPSDYTVKRGEQRVAVTPTQFKLLVTFLTHPDQLLSRPTLKEKVWEHVDISYRSIDAQISKLKKVVPELNPFLLNIYGKGYILTRESAPRAA